MPQLNGRIGALRTVKERVNNQWKKVGNRAEKGEFGQEKDDLGTELGAAQEV